VRQAYEPLFGYLFGLKPWETERLTHDQWLGHKAIVDRWRAGDLRPRG
jgi:hypothetical protein